MEANSPRKGLRGEGRRKSKRTGTRANSFALLHLTRPPFASLGQYRFIRSFFSTTLRPFFLSVPCLCGPTVDSIPFPAILEIRFLSSVMGSPACAQSLLSIFLEFSSIGSSNFLSIYLFTLFGNQILFGEVEIFHLEIKEIGKK